jgi:hypothetical protein
MNEPFILPVVYQGTEHEFKARFERFGNTHHVAVLIDETTFTFEPDEEGGYRTLATVSTAVVNSSLLQAIAEKLAKLNS